jgi:hypothetical protein
MFDIYLDAFACPFSPRQGCKASFSYFVPRYGKALALVVMAKNQP